MDATAPQKNIKVAVQTQTIDWHKLINELQNDNTSRAGAFVYFVGMVRDFVDTNGTAYTAKSLYLEYYPGMCEKEIYKICAQAQQRWNVHDIVVIHRVGELQIGEPIVFIGVASTHRTGSFNACEYIIDALKTRAPFWKQERLADGNKFWVKQQKSDEEKTLAWQ